jgi:hypothetical protein
MGFAEPIIGPATSGRTRWLYRSYALVRSFPRTRGRAEIYRLLCNSDAAVQPRKDSHSTESPD